MKKILLLICVFVLFVGVALIAFADWDPGDGYKMHFPQLPDPDGWDVAFDGDFGQTPLELAEDWQCSETGPVSDIHFWISYFADDIIPIQSVRVKIYSNNPQGPSMWSEPNELLWDREFQAGQFIDRPYGTGLQGWYDPWSGNYEEFNHLQYFQINITDIDDPFIQQEGEIYWLSLEVVSDLYNVGWKTSVDHWNDDAVWREPGGPWIELRDPLTGESLDFSFVITTKEEPKPATPHLKWSQPPVEIDPLSEIPLYCGWDEESHNLFDFPVPVMQIVADDFRCLGTMPVTSVHWWGSHVGWEGQDLPPEVPEAWRIAFWSNVPASADVQYSRPERLLWQIDIPANRVKVERVGTDYHPSVPFSDTCFQYNIDLNRDEIFWQNEFIDKTTDNIFWISIVAEYNDVFIPNFPWGWKTRPWSWMDDAVTFMVEEPDVNTVLDPLIITPLEYGSESYDVCFELDTDPNWIKWEQAYDGIRNWPHYEDEESMGFVNRWTVMESKWLQDPDLSLNGMDVDATMEIGTIDPLFPPQILADDFNCVMTGPITQISIWGSWLYDEIPLQDPAAVEFTLSIYSDNPSGPSGWSEPNELRWRMDFPAGGFRVSLPEYAEEGYYSPCRPWYEPANHTWAFKYTFDIDPAQAFIQQGDPCEPVIYWLAVQARPIPADLNYRFGWKTSIMQWNDDAVWAIGEWGDPCEPWIELRHPETSESLDLAFEIVTSHEEEEIVIDRLAADDWPCDSNGGVSAIVWWGSYIGYRYEACRFDALASLPVPPDYFLLNIWTDVAIGDPTNQYPYSHPGDKIWEYRAYDYDEVLVGYDKHPHEPGQPSVDPNEPVFRYSVRIPDDAQFQQDTADGIYWLSIVAVYDNSDPIYLWGWTNHEHMYNDDAVAGYVDPTGGQWTWEELYDQTETSEDLSFVLFTECMTPSNSAYPNWSYWNKPHCWCYARQCRGDVDGLKFANVFWVSGNDLNILKGAINKPEALIPPGGECADLDHMKFANVFWVSGQDLNIMKQYINKPEAMIPVCGNPPDSNFNFWTLP